MNITATNIEGVYIIERTPFSDERGYFVRAFCRKELSEAGINADFVQSNISGNYKKGTVRGMHAQKDGYEEEKLVGCTRGKIFDVCVDLREESATYLQYVGIELSEENGRMLYIPKGCAHGYQTLEDHTQVFYFVTQYYAPGSEVGYCYDDPKFAIDWPIKENLIISAKDQSWKKL
jgi:dTDP-4-dehydrorhamnose 3,5-epimerase